MTPGAFSTGSMCTVPVKVAVRCPDGWPDLPWLTCMASALLLLRLVRDADAAGQVAEGVDDAVADQVTVAERVGHLEGGQRARAGERDHAEVPGQVEVEPHVLGHQPPGQPALQVV